MRIECSRGNRGWIGLVAWVASTFLTVGEAIPDSRDDFERSLVRVDQALQTNPNHVNDYALDYCHGRRIFAGKLFYSGRTTRARRSLKSCFQVLGIPEENPRPLVEPKTEIQVSAEVRARAARELAKALELTPDIEHGLEIYRGCAACHTPEGWGLSSGIVPQLAGQRHKVVIKQLADIRAGNRANPVMLPYSSAEAIGGSQAVADVAGYIDTLEISVENGKGSGDALALGASLYEENCARCHGSNGEGDNDKFVPRIQAQHFGYLMTQFESIRDGRRRNANAEMVAQIAGFSDPEMRAVLDYVSRLEPPEELQAPPGWRNPDFSEPLAPRKPESPR